MNNLRQYLLLKIIAAALLSAVLPAFLLAQKVYRAGDYYHFNVMHYNADGTTWENNYSILEKDLRTFHGASQEFWGFKGGMIEDSTRMVCKPLPSVGLGIRFNPRAEGYFGYQVRIFSRKYNSHNVFDSSAVSIIAIGIHPGNADSFQYRIIINDSIVYRDWSSFTAFRTVPETGYRYADIGNFCFYRKYMVLEVRNKKSGLISAGMIVNWPVPAALSLGQTRIYYKEDNILGMNGFLDPVLLHKGYATQKDAVTGVLSNLKLPGDKEYLDAIFDFNNVQQTFGYKAVLERNVDGKKDTVEVAHYFNEPSLRVNKELFAQPGKYRLLVGNFYFFNSPDYHKWVLEIPFEVLSPTGFAKKYSLKQLLPYILGIVMLIAAAFYGYYRYNRSRLNKAERGKQVKQMQLRNLQNQLNPHFLFNALSAIQNLIGKKDIESASRYLSNFSSLTRTVLETSGQELVSLDEELSMLRSYLQMEQLRIPFQYNIITGEEVDIVNTEIPAMLLQPFVENAVKHGVALIKEKGMIVLKVDVLGQSMVLTVSDNGGGIQADHHDTNNTGMGLSLFRERVRLLNEMYGNETVTWHMQSGIEGTVVTIQLHDWLT
ncbi:MAG: histidine kinase [Chitinophagaceae bacterium]